MSEFGETQGWQGSKMQFSQKSQYALRALFELSKRKGNGPVRIADVAKAQDIPRRFLESILSELRRGGFVASHRGREGGYTMVCEPSETTVGDILRFVEGPMGPIDCICGKSTNNCTLRGKCVFEPMWVRVREAMLGVLQETTLASLMEEEKRFFS